MGVRSILGTCHLYGAQVVCVWGRLCVRPVVCVENMSVVYGGQVVCVWGRLCVKPVVLVESNVCMGVRLSVFSNRPGVVAWGGEASSMILSAWGTYMSVWENYSHRSCSLLFVSACPCLVFISQGALPTSTPRQDNS